ncbi:MAG: shikimate dehydrogenase [Acidimicrobiia bacterium]
MASPVVVNGETRVTGLIGDPVSHTRSPAILNAAFAEAGLNWIYVAFPVPEGYGGDAVKAVRHLHLAGLTVTMPHKADAAWACDELTADATALGAVNVITLLENGRVRGASTDGEGFVRSVRDEGVDPAGKHAVVLGAGGAARAIVLALGNAGAEVTVAARRHEAAEAAAGLVRGGRSVALIEADVGAFDLVVNATPVGMQGEPPPIDPERLNPSQLVVDTIYHPMETPLLAAARARGVPCANGLGMLVHQAALAFELWTGCDAPLDVMRSAAARDPRA